MFFIQLHWTTVQQLTNARCHCPTNTVLVSHAQCCNLRPLMILQPSLRPSALPSAILSPRSSTSSLSSPRVSTPRMFSSQSLGAESFQRVLHALTPSPSTSGRVISPKLALASALRKASSIVAHRGGSKIGPENTEGGLKNAFNKGAKGVEFDIQVTSDGHLIVLHDDTLERTAVPYTLAKDFLPKTIDEVTNCPMHLSLSILIPLMIPELNGLCYACMCRPNINAS